MGKLERCAGRVAVVTALWLLGLSLALAVTAVLIPFNDTRLASTLGLTRGYPLYSIGGSGPALDYLYGPVAALVYLPVTICTRPDTAIRLGSLLSRVYALSPLFLLAWLFRRSERNPRGCPLFPHGVLIALAAVALCTADEALLQSTCNITADVPALGAAGLACCGLIASQIGGGLRSEPSTQVLVACGLLLALSITSKLVTIPLLPGLVLLGFFFWGTRAAAKLLLATCLFIALILGAAMARWGREAVMLQMWVVPSSHQLAESGMTFSSLPLLAGVKLIATKSIRLFRAEPWMLWIWLTLIMLGVEGEDSQGGAGGILRRRGPEFLLIVAAFAVLPTATLAIIKVGGSINNYSFFRYFLMMSMEVATLRLTGQADASLSRTLLISSMAFALTFTAVATLNQKGRIWPVGPICSNPTGAAYDYMMAHNDDVYFSYLPSAHLLAQGKLYHFSYGLTDLKLAGRALTFDQFLSFVPKSAKYLAEPPISKDASRDYLTAATKPELRPGLPIQVYRITGAGIPASR
jgi:hypothetical protein